MHERNLSGDNYLLEHTPQAIQRLLKLGQIYEPFTRRVLVEAGVTTGMKVLDVGCGPGEVSLIAAGLLPPTLSAQAIVGAGPAHSLYAHIVGLTRTLLPTIEALGMASASEVDIETPEQRLSDEVASADAAIVWVSLIGAASRKATDQ